MHLETGKYAVKKWLTLFTLTPYREYSRSMIGCGKAFKCGSISWIYAFEIEASTF